MKTTCSSVVPWRNQEQFCKVYKCLYSNNISDKRWAVDQIAEWDTRCHPALPIAVETTVTFVRAFIQDTLFQAEKSLCLASDIQMFYAMALIRFVNLTMEGDPNISNLFRSELAEKLNIPNWIICLRHQSAHSFCPTLPVLRLAARSAMEYLEKQFWRVEAANLRPIVHPSTTEQEIQILIIQYKDIQHERLERKRDTDALKQDLATVLKTLRGYMKDSGKLVIKCLVKPDVFISGKDLIKMLQNSVSLYMEYASELPDQLQNFWTPMIRLLHTYDFIPNLVEKLLLSQEERIIPVNNKLTAAWVMKLLLAASKFSSDIKLKSMFQQKAVQFNYYRLFYACLKGINEYFVPVLKIITARLGDSHKFCEMFTLAFLKQGWLVTKKAAEPRRLGPRPASKRARDAMMREIVFTLADAEEDLNELKTRRKRMRRDDNIFALAPVDLDWSDKPLGIILNPDDGIENQDAPKVEGPTEIIVIKDEMTSCIINNENDSEESTAQEMVTPDICQETYIPQMVYRRRQ